MPEDLVTLKDEMGKVTRAVMESREILTKATDETKALGKRTEEALAKMGTIEAGNVELTKEVRKAAEDLARVSKEHDEIMTRIQANKVLPGSDADDKAGQEVARRSYTRMLRNMSRQDLDLGHGMDAAEKEFLMSIPEAKQKRALFVSQDELGGFLVNPVISSRVVSKLVQVSPIRQAATVMGIGSAQSLKFSREVGTFSAGWSHERGTRAETTGETFKGIEIMTHEQYALVRLGYQLIEDASFNIEAFVEGRITRQFARVEGLAFVSGNGVGQPEGFLTNPEIEVFAATVTAASGQFTPDDVIDLFAGLKTEYAANGTVLTHRKTVAAMRKFKDNVNRWLDLVERGALNGIRTLAIDGYPALEVPDQPVWNTSLAKALAFGDFMEGYTIVDRSLMSIIRDPYTRKTAGEVEIQYMRRVGGKVVQPEAIKILQANT